MLEDSSAMDKKTCGRSTQSTTKSTSESRKVGDLSGPARYNRRRESANSKNGNSDSGRRSTNPVKQGKFVDKRPRPRGQYYGSGKQETQVEEVGDDPENGSLGTCGRKKQNLNHLLNFTLAPRPAVGSGSNSLKPRLSSGNWLATHKHKYNKEEFLQANCQFVVKTGIDYSPYMVDPDILVDWSYIEQIRLRSSELLACPICLEKPIAAKMTRCGHVYCWPCILHYLALSDKSWRKCPICYESVHKNDLKSVVTISDSLSCVDKQFTLKLMKRERGSLLAVPLEESDISRQAGVLLSVSETTLSKSFSKLLLADADDVQAVTRLERIELETELKSVGVDPEVCFIEQALELLSNREKSLHISQINSSPEPEENAPEERTSVDLDNVKVVADPFKEVTNGDEQNYVSDDSHKDVEEDSEECVNVSPEDVETEEQVAGQKPFYFYQAADGQNVFLNALNLRMLEMQYGTIAHAPLTITGTVLEKETGSMTRELRNRLRSLSHLPITAAFELLELDMKSLVSREVLQAFAEHLRVRADKRHRREREERRRDRKIMQQVELQWGQRPGHRMRLDSARHFPKCGEELLEDVGPPSVALSRSNSLSSVGSSSYPDISEPASNSQPQLDSNPWPSPQSESAGPSFAQMLKVGAKPVGRSSRRTTWGQPEPMTSPLPTTSGIVNDDDEYGAPLYQQSFGDAIARAIDRADFNLGDAGKGKKKKRKQKVLFSSGMSFASK